MPEKSQKCREWSRWHLLLLIQCVAVLWPPWFNAADPHLAGIPFFYWYQLAWVLIGAVLTGIVHVATDKTTTPQAGLPGNRRTLCKT